MVTYDFYKNIYLGSTLSETAFGEAAVRAEDWITKLERTCQVAPYGPDSRAMAVCAVAETMEVFNRRRFVSQASVGGVSVRYESNVRQLERQLYQNAGVYLDIRRGVL